MESEWDDAEDLNNQRKHGLSFAEAQRLFESGVDYLEIFDARLANKREQTLYRSHMDRYE